MLALAQPAEAKIIYTHVHHVIEPGHEYHLDLVGRGVTDFNLINSALRWCDGLSAYCFGLEQTAPRKNSTMGYYSGNHGTWDSALTAGRRIGPHLNFHPAFGDLASGFLTATLTGYAYETIPGKSIIAGKTKGPDEIASVEPLNAVRPQWQTAWCMSVRMTTTCTR
jgi:hypothetical protein